MIKIVHILSLDVPRRSDLCLVARDQSFIFVFSRVNSSNAEVFGQNMIYYSYARQKDKVCTFICVKQNASISALGCI